MWRRISLVFVSFLVAGCFTTRRVDPTLKNAVEQQNATQLADALEQLIEDGRDTRSDREYAHYKVQAWRDGTAAYSFARALISARLAEQRGVTGLEQLKEAERYALRSISISPSFSNGAARRLLGTLYVMAGQHTRQGDSEAGLAMLEDLTQQFPDNVPNHLRLAEAYIVLGDVESSLEPLCRALVGRDALKGSERDLLVRLVAEAGGDESMSCGE